MSLDQKTYDENEMDGYQKIDKFNPQTIASLSNHYDGIIKDIGENVNREGIVKTPERAAKAIQFLTHGYDLNPEEILKSALFKDDYRQMVIVKDIEIYSMCE